MVRKSKQGKKCTRRAVRVTQNLQSLSIEKNTCFSHSGIPFWKLFNDCTSIYQNIFTTRKKQKQNTRFLKSDLKDYATHRGLRVFSLNFYKHV